MSRETRRERTRLETVEPLGKRVLIRKDEDKKSTKGGIALPDNIEIPTITGRIATVSAQLANDDDFPIRQYDKVLFNPKNSIPVDFEPGNQLFVVPIEDVVAVFRQQYPAMAAPTHAAPRPGDIIHSRGAPEEAAAALGFHPAVAVEDGLRELIRHG